MMDFLATNFNLPTIIGAVIVFGGTGLIVWHSHKHGGVGCDCGGSCHGECGCSGGCNGSCKENAEELAKFKRIAEEKAKANASQVHSRLRKLKFSGIPARRAAGSNARGSPHFLSAALWCGLLDME